MKKVISKKHGVVNTVSEDQFEYLMKTGDYEEYSEPEAPKRKRRTKAEIEADKAKEDK